MTTFAARSAPPRLATWIGLTLSALTTLFLLADAAVGLLFPDRLSASTQETGFQPGQVPMIGGIVLVCAILYAIPRTTVLGAILVTGFFGGAICTHFRLGEVGSPPQLVALFIGVMAWAGLYLRDERLRALLPLRSGKPA